MILVMSRCLQFDCYQYTIPEYEENFGFIHILSDIITTGDSFMKKKSVEKIYIHLP